MRTLSFTKMQAVGNDFVMVDAMEGLALDWPAVARRLCRRHVGVGADGLMVLDRAPSGMLRARMFNPDGTEDMCGNGTRCAAVLLHRKGHASGAEFQILTRSGRRDVRLLMQAGRAVGASVNMGRPEFAAERLPSTFDGDAVLERPIRIAGETFQVSSVLAGSTHTVIVRDALPDDEAFARWSPQIECFPAFTERTSVLWAVLDSPARARVRIWERGGVGESLGCGTGACAVAAVAKRLGLAGDRLTVESKGGALEVITGQGDQQWLRGPAEAVFTGEITLRGM